MDDGDAGMSEKGSIIKGKGKEKTVAYVEPGEVERERWKKILNDHKGVLNFYPPFQRIYAFIRQTCRDQP